MIGLLKYQKEVARNNLNKILSKISNSLCKPTSIHLSITNKCTLKCRQCDIWKNIHPQEMSTEEIKKVISELRKWLGPFTLNISGGEPFTRKDIFEIIEYASQKNIDIIITSNGHAINKEISKKILNSKLKGLNISLDGIKPETHDYIRNRKGCFKKVTETITDLNKEKRSFQLSIATVLSGYNLQEIIPLVDWVEKNRLNGIIFQPLYNNFGRDYDQKWYEKSEFWPKNKEEIKKVIDDLIIKKKEGYKILNPVKQLKLFKEYFENPCKATNIKCQSGIKNYAINEKGEALLCFWLRPIGNSITQKPKDIWLSEEAKKRRTQIKNCDKNCKLLNCHFT